MFFKERKIGSTERIKITSDPETIFNFLIDPENTPKWMNGIEYVSHRPTGAIEIGSEVNCNISAMGLRKSAQFKFSKISAPRNFAINGESAGVRYESMFTLSQREKTPITEIVWSIELWVPPILLIGAPFAISKLSQDMRKNLERLSQKIEECEK